MLRKPFHLPNGVTLLETPVYLGRVQKLFHTDDTNFTHEFSIGTRAGVITLYGSEDLLTGLRVNLLADEIPNGVDLP